MLEFSTTYLWQSKFCHHLQEFFCYEEEPTRSNEGLGFAVGNAANGSLSLTVQNALWWLPL